jgi:hypothetical protein
VPSATGNASRGHELVKDRADGARRHRLAFAKREDRPVRDPGRWCPARQIIGTQLADPRPKDTSRLCANFRLAHDEQLPRKIAVPHVEPLDFADAEP